MTQKMSVLVMSCDAFEDVWQPFFTLFEKYWAECPFQKYFCTDIKPVQQKGFTPITVGKDFAWSYRFKYALEQLTTPYVLFLQDDFFLMKPADNLRIFRYLDILEKEQAAILRIFPTPAPNSPYKFYKDIGLVDKNVSYRVSCQATIWNREVLLELINETDNIWAFEIEGTKRSNEIEKPFLSVVVDEMGEPLEAGNYAYSYFCTAVFKGKWMRGAVELCRTEGIELDFSKRQVETLWQEKRRYIYDRTPKILQKYVWYLFFKILK
jgi:hypothetical protein